MSDTSSESAIGVIYDCWSLDNVGQGPVLGVVDAILSGIGHGVITLDSSGTGPEATSKGPRLRHRARGYDTVFEPCSRGY